MTDQRDLFEVTTIADSFDRLRAMNEGAVDIIITDPPYSAHCHANMMSGTTFKRYVNGESRRSGVPKVEAQFDPLTSHEWARDIVRVAKRWGLVFCTLEDFGRFDLALGRKEYVRSGVWFKSNSMGQLTGDRPAAACEGIAILHRTGKKRWNGRGSFGVWKCNGTRGEKGRHPNQKPLNLCLMLVAKFSDRGDTIFDPFCGSGRIGEAALLLGRRYVGIDHSAEWVEKATARLAATTERFGSIADAAALSLCSMNGSPNGTPKGGREAA